MLKLRLITAAILIPLVIAAIFFLPPMTFLCVAMLVLLLAAWEWAGLCGLTSFLGKSLYLAVLAAVLVASLFIPVMIVIVIGIIWWLIALILLLIFPRFSEQWGKDLFIKATMGIFVFLPCWVGLILLQGYSPMVLMFCLVLIWAVDSAAYFVGRKWGKHKLSPIISPGKSYEGLLTGLATSLIVGLFGLWLLEISSTGSLVFLLICLIGGGFITVLGDLFESMVKRVSHTKDSGSLLPGHGGLLDRIDSMLTAIPFFALVIPYFFSN
jgi:phosphatidate cytidylyltransferase